MEEKVEGIYDYEDNVEGLQLAFDLKKSRLKGSGQNTRKSLFHRVSVLGKIASEWNFLLPFET